MRKRLFILTILTLFFYSNGMAQKVWTIEDCVNFAVRNNLNIEKSELQNSINKENFNQSIRNLLPGVQASSGSGLSFGKTVDPTTYDFVNQQFFYSNYSLGASVTIFDGFTQLNTISYNKLNYLAGLKDESQQKNDLAFSVLSDYFNVLFYQGLLSIAKEQKELSEMNLKKARVMFDSGLNSKSDLLEMESRLATEELYVIQTRNQVNTSLLQLEQHMNYKGEDPLVLESNTVENNIAGSVTGIDSVYNQALNSNPGLKAAKLRKMAAEKNLSIVKGQFLPSLSMSGGYNSNYAKLKGSENAESFKDQFKNNASQSVSMSLTIPVFYKWSVRSQVKRAKLGLSQAQKDVDLEQQQLYQEIEMNFNEMLALSAEYEQMIKQWEASKIAYQAAEKKLAQGLIDPVLFYESKNLMAQAESNVLRTKLTFELKKRTIDIFIGKPIYTED
ncbi:MAG: TolC family protein [Prolixibacteraceae bacterium]|nr:TolC family protein [Prolixibacteraceae bacterium]